MLIEVILTAGLVVCLLLAGVFLLLRPYLSRAAQNVREDYEREVIRDQVEEQRRKEHAAGNAAAQVEVEDALSEPPAGGEGEERVDER